jgi:hypothetical protein
MRMSLGGIVLAIGLLSVSSAFAAPATNYTPIPAPPPVALVAACLANGSLCSADADCCSHKCFPDKRGNYYCRGKLAR